MIGRDPPDIAAGVDRARELARRLAATADDVARTFEHAAAIHDEMADNPRHPLHATAAARAAAQRSFAAAERLQSIRLREQADGDPTAQPALLTIGLDAQRAKASVSAASSIGS